MLRIYALILQVVREVAALLEEIGRRDPDLKRQGMRALTSVPLNCAEGGYSHGRNRRARYFNALGSMKEVEAVLDVSEALGYVRVDPGLRDRIAHVCATFVRLVR